MSATRFPPFSVWYCHVRPVNASSLTLNSKTYLRSGSTVASATVAPSSAAYRNLPFGEIAIASMPRLLGCVAGCPTGRCGLFGDCSPPGIGERRIEEAALGVEVEDPRTELVADPQVAVTAALHRLGVDVGTRQQPLRGPFVDDREADHAVRIAELDESTDVDGRRFRPRPS